MVDEELLQYIKENKRSYGLDKIKKGLLKQGVSEKEIEEALDFLKSGGTTNEKVVKKNVGLKSPLKMIGVARGEMSFYYSTMLYGAISFVFINVIITFFEYVFGRMVFAKISPDLGTLSSLALPQIFLTKISLLLLIWSLVCSAFWGALLLALFFKYLFNIWPFKLWGAISKKTFFFFLAIQLLYGLFYKGIFMSMSSVYFSAYFFILIGMVFSSYLATIYFLNNLAGKHPKALEEMARKAL